MRRARSVTSWLATAFTRPRSIFAVERATEYRFLDENRFCSYFIEERKRRGWGQRKIETELKRRHVVLDDIPGYPEDYFAVEDDLARASALLAKRRVPETRGFEKLVRFLMGKGFSYHIAADAVKARLDAERENVRFRRMRFVALPFTAF